MSGRSAFGLAMIAGLFIAAGLDSSAAQERTCGASYRFIWGQDSSGTFSTKSGVPCRVMLRMAGNSTVASAQIVTRPRNGSASTGRDGTVRYQPKAGFTGTDTLAVQYRGTGSSGSARPSTVTFTVTVY
jgi:hypothetical protein